jgi:lysozyme
MLDMNAFEEHLVWAEDERLDLYKDSVGIYTIGVGHNIQEKGISKVVSRQLLKEDMDEVLGDCRGLAYWNNLVPARQLVVADMVFNLGLTKFLKFKRLNGALEINDFVLAAHEMKDSQWYVQVGRRAEKLVPAMLTGVWK